jgi:hypothetical protein
MLSVLFWKLALPMWAVNVLHLGLHTKGPHRLDAIRQSDARIFSFQKQIKPSTDKNFTRYALYADQIAKIA